MGYLIVAYPVLGAAAFLCGMLLVPLCRRLALRFDYVDRPGLRKIHAASTPYGGGAAIFATFILICATAYAVVLLGGVRACGFEALAGQLDRHLNGLTDVKTRLRLAALLGGGGALFLLGLIDDRRPLGPKFKLAVQILAACGLWMTGTRITLFVDTAVVSLILTVVWVVGITNAMNLLDNMDGLSAGVGAIAATIFMLSAIQAEQLFVAALLAVLVGSLSAFLLFNFNPASIFMGDAGALFLGFTLAAVSIRGTYYVEGQSAYAVVLPVVVLAIPLFDTASVMLIRLRSGQPLMVGDKNHFSHRLVRLGMTVREAVGTIYILSATLGLPALLLPRLDDLGTVIVFLHTLGVLAVIGLLEIAAVRRRCDDA